MNNQSVKRRRVDDDDGSAIAIDRLSQLPQPILHNILSLLSQKDAVQTSVLSKSWRYLWHGRLNVEFRYNWFARKNVFLSFLDTTLQRYLDQNLSLQKFLVDIYHYEVDLVLLQKWIPVLIMNMGVKSLNLSFSWTTKASYPLPLVVFQSESLVELHLNRCDLSILKSTHNVMLNNLQTLHLEEVDITDEIFEKILLGCPLIETLNLSKCIGLKSIKLHKHHIVKNFRCFMDERTIIEIEDPHTLESLYIEYENYRCPDWYLPFTNMHFPHLKCLDLYRVHLPAETFDNFSSFFPCLSELILKSCDGLKKFRLLSSSIRRLTIKTDLKNRIKAFIDTPNILYFEFSGAHCFLPLIKFTTPSNEWKSQISLHYMPNHSEKDDTPWLLKLHRLLKSLSQSHITLSLYHMYKKLHINDSYAGFYEPIVVEHFKLYEWLCPPELLDPTLFNCFFRIFRPRYIHMDCYVAKKLSEFICYLIPEKKRYYFWLQDLEELIIEVWDMKAEEWNCVQHTSLQALPNKQTILFRLTWREQLSKPT